MLNDVIASDLGLTFHSNKRDVWIVAKDSTQNFFRSYLAKDNGIKLLQTSIINYSSGYIRLSDFYKSPGNLKISIKGDILSFCHPYSLAPNLIDWKLILARFNNSTGVISDPITIDKNLIGYPVSVEISPNSRFVYVTTCDTVWYVSPGGNKTKKVSSIYQLDVSNWDSSSIANSIIPLYKAISSNNRDKPDTLFWQLQLGPNGKIYLLEEIKTDNQYNEYTYHISSINKPNQKGLTCNFEQNFIVYGVSSHWTGLPKCLFKDLLSVVVKGDTVCEGDFLKISSSVESEVEGYKYFWTGPGGYISLDTNIVFQKAMPSMTGWYKLKVTLNDLEASDSVFVKVYSKPNIGFEPNNPVHFCQGDSATVKALSDSLIVSYKWSNGAKTQAITVKKGGYYTVIVSDIHGCENKDSVLVIVDSLPIVKIVPEGATNFCIGDSVMLQATPDSLDFLWSTGEKTKSIIVKQSGVYYLEGSNQSGCKAMDSIKIKVLPNLEPTILVDGNNPNCEGDSVMLSSSMTGSEYNYLWSTGETNESILVRKSGLYKLKVSLEGSCEGIDSVDITFNPNPIVKILGETIFCTGDTIILSSNNDFAHYLWTTGDTTKSIMVSKGGRYGVTVTNKYGCKADDTIDVKEISFSLDLSELNYDFGKVLINSDSTYKYTFTNSTDEVISFKNAQMMTNDGVFDVTTNPSLPITLLPGDSLEFTIKFFPKELKSYANLLKIAIDNPCPAEYIFNEIGLGFMRMYVWFPDTTGVVGTSNYCIPMKSYPLSEIKSPMMIPFSSQVSWLSENYIVDRSNPVGIITNNTVDSKQKLEISGTYELKQDGHSRVTNIYGTILLSDKRTTPISIDSFATGNKLIEIVRKDGRLTTTGVCAWDLRQIIPREIPQIMINPNPANDYLDILLKGDKNYSYSLKIYSINGSNVFSESGSLNKKELEIKVNTVDYPSGLYVIQVWLNNEFITGRFMIIK